MTLVIRVRNIFHSIHSCCSVSLFFVQMTFNVDGISLLEKNESPDGGVADALKGGEETDCFDATCNKGTKSLNGYVIVVLWAFWVNVVIFIIQGQVWV